MLKNVPLPRRQTKLGGYSEERRRLLATTPAALAAFLLPPSSLLAALEEGGRGESLEDFIQAVSTQAARLKGDRSAAGQDAYVEYIARRVAAVRDVATDSLSDESWKGMDPGVFLGGAGQGRVFFVAHWRLSLD